ncbi:dTDP-glucose 4,6-dehydratase [Dyella halodurans]|uniref:dTDP-glucose 4,6-dehydratase n=1 Tax=Dyella halodurans TaxID=1920171 RepID=A0ABV9BX79_9GAMM|nr:dTDP-glucose 4,6-dehydratase [Dyella halodurans]
MSIFLVTGGAGFIGGNFVHRAVADGHRVINLDKLTYAGNLSTLETLRDHPGHRFVRGDIGDATLVSSLLAEHRPDAVVNFAAESHVDRSIDGPAAFIQTNVAATLTLLEATRDHWLDLPEADARAFRFLHVSTDEVFGSLGPEGRFTEITPFAPNSPYAASKAASDHLVRAFQHTYGLPTLTTNCSNNYGPFQFPEKLIPLMIQKALAGEELPVYGDGMNVRDWLFVQDHCEAISAVLERGLPGQTYNIGGDSEQTNLDVVRSLCVLLDQRVPTDRPRELQIRFVRDRPGHDRRYAIDASKIRRDIGWTPRNDFASGLAHTVDWYLANQPWVAGILDGSYRLERLGQ